MATSRSAGAGGKIVTNRRKHRLAATPYDRPPPPAPQPQQEKNPNWFTGVVIPSARSIASGAGKFLTSAIFSDSESSSSDDEESAGEDDDVNEYENAHDGVNASNKENLTSSEIMQYGHKSIFSPQRTETKQIIEQLIMQETFTREESDRLKEVLNSRVVDGSLETGEKRSLAESPKNMVDREDVDISNKAVLEAMKWFQTKKVGSSAVTKLTHRARNLNSAGVEHVENGDGSPLDVARSYMRDRPPWASPTKHVELGTPLTTKTLFDEGASYSVSYDSLSSKRRNSLASGSWNIQEELRRVRSKATEDMLRTPSSKLNPSLVTATWRLSTEAGKLVAEPDFLGKRKPIDSLIDVGVRSDPVIVALESRQGGKASEALSPIPVASVSGNNEDSEAIHMDGEYAPSKSPHPTGPSHAGDNHSDPHLSNINGPLTTEIAESGERPSENGFSSSQACLPAGEAAVQNHKQYDEETGNEHNVSEKKSTSSTNVEGKRELLTEPNMEVPVVTETDSLAASGSKNSIEMQPEESSLEMAQPSPQGKADITGGEQQGRRSSRLRGKRQR